MKKERLIWAGIIVAVLLGSWLVQTGESQRGPSPPSPDPPIGRHRVLPTEPTPVPTDDLTEEVHTNTANVYNLQEDVSELRSRVSALEDATHIH